jgi:tetratricopeptide (TPR) repeat protein
MMRLDELIEDLRDESALWDTLSADSDDDADAVRTVFAWSYRALPEPAARLFRLLGLHPGNEFGADAVAILADTDVRDARRQLDVLVGAHLVNQPAPGRYELHDLLRAYATDQVRQLNDAQSRSAALRRILTWYLHAADAAQRRIAGFDAYPLHDPAPPDMSVPEFLTYEAALRWYQTENTNLVGATRAAAAADLHPIAWRLAAVLSGIYMHQNAFEDWLATGHIGVDSAARDNNLTAQADAYASLGTAYLQSGRLDDAEASQREALAVRQRLDDRRGEAVSLNALGLIGLRTRRLDDAVSSFDRGRASFRELGDRRWAALLQSNLAQTLWELQRYAEAEPLLDEALAVFRDLGDRSSEGNALFLLSRLRRETGDPAAARTAIERALAIAEEDENQVWQAHWLVEFGDVQRAADQPADALVSYQQAASIQRRLGDRSREATAIEAAGHAYEDMGRVAEATDFYTVAAGTHRDLHDQWREAQALSNLANAFDRQGDTTQARSRRQEALPLLDGFDDPRAATLRHALRRQLAAD